MEGHIRTATVLAHMLDNQFNFFGIRFGMNGFLGLIPGVGDAIVALLSLYLIWIGVKLQLPRIKLIEMVANVAVNFFIGLIPVLGDTLDFFHKANIKNLRILKEHIKNPIIEGNIVEPIHPVGFR